MTASGVGLCRLSVRAEHTSFDLAVPTDVPLADLMPTIVGYARGAEPGRPAEQGYWALQRVGAEPLDEDGTIGSLDLHDGDVLYLRPRTEALPAIRFDDLVDGIANGLRDRADSWQPELSRRVLLGAALVAVAVGFVAMTAPGAGPLATVANGVVAALLLVAAATASRAVDDATAGTVLGAAAVPFAALAGWLVPTGAAGIELAGGRLLAAGAAAAGAAVLALAGTAVSAPLFVGLGTVAVTVAGGGTLLISGVGLTTAAGILAAIVVLAGSFVPAVSFRLSGLRLPPLPTNAVELQDGIEPYPSTQVLVRSEIADAYMTTLYCAVGSVLTACLVALAFADGWPAVTLALVLGLLLVLHSRSLGSVWQRIALLVPGLSGPALTLLHRMLPGGPSARLQLLVVGLLVATVLVITAWTVPGRRMVPYWGRAADLLHTTLAVAVIPLVTMVAGIFPLLRGIDG